jgi:hypothetical protein
MMNRSAKDGKWLSGHYSCEGIFGSNPSYQGVCERHGKEDLYVTPGELSGSSERNNRSKGFYKRERSEERSPESSRRTF